MHYVARTLNYSIVFPPKRGKPGVVGAHDLLNPPSPQSASNLHLTYVYMSVNTFLSFPPQKRKLVLYTESHTTPHTHTQYQKKTKKTGGSSKFLKKM